MTTADLPNEDPTGGTSVLGDGQPFAGEGGTTNTAKTDRGSEAGAGDNGEQAEEAPADGSTDRFAAARSGVVGLRDQALDQVRTYATTGKDTLTTTIGGYAETVRGAAQEIEDRTNPEIAKYAHQAADFLEEAAETLRTKDVEELVDEARELVRRSPALAIGAAAAIGFALSRFLKATSDGVDANFVPSARTRDESRPAYDA